MNIKNMVETPHRVYRNYFHYFNFLLDSYEGGVDYTKATITKNQIANDSLFSSLFRIKAGGRQMQTKYDSNLFMHPKEKSEDFERRVNMSYYYNFCSPIVDIFTDHLFKQKIIADFGSIKTEVEYRQENINNKNSSIDEFRKETADLAQVFGHIFVVVDNLAVPAGREILSFQDQIDYGLFPYNSFIFPQNVINWSLDEFGRPYWVLIRETSDGNIDPFNFDKDAAENLRYRLWTRQEWIIFNKDYEEVERGTHGLGLVPIVCVFDKQSKKQQNFLGISALADIAFIARDIYNKCSELNQILRDQTFSFLAIQGTSSEYNELSVGTGKALLYPEGREKPEYVSPPSANAEVYFSQIDRQISKIFQLAKLEGGSAKFEGQNVVEQSGVSKAWDFNQTNSSLSKKSGNYEDGEMKIWQVYAAWLGKEFDGSIQYPTEFNMQSLYDDLDEAEKIMKLNICKSFNVEIKKAIIKKKFPRMPEAEIEKMCKEAEENEGKDASGGLLAKVPSIMQRIAANANAGGNGGIRG